MSRVSPPSDLKNRASGAIGRAARLPAGSGSGGGRDPSGRGDLDARSAAPGDDAPPEIDREGRIARLRLAIGKDGLGIELADPAQMECLDVVELVVRLPHVKFPFDVSGGVAKFRHKRGELERVAIELDARRVARWAEPRLRGLLSAGPCTVVVDPRAFGATVTVHARSSVRPAAVTTGPMTGEATPRLPALAFDLALVSSHAALAIVVHGARGAHLAEPATTLAIRAVAALLGDGVRREGARFVVPDAAGRLARALLPEAGVRAPGADDVSLSGSGESDGVLYISFVRSGPLAKVPDDATLAAEAATITREADDARFAKELDRARHLDLASLERAPRHPEIARRIAEIDSAAGGRAEAACVTLREITSPVHLGLLAGELLYEAGDAAGAIAALLRAGERDPSHVVAALAYARAADLARDPHDALAWLDAAVARAPRLGELRWERARRRLSAGRLAEARADFQELEALAHGSRDRHDVLRRAGDAYRASGLGADAAALYERALLYRPDDPVALAGLGASLAAEGRAARGAAILAHAIETAEAAGLETAWMHLELGRVLGERLGDRPAAVARLRAVPDEAPEAIAARGLEGRLRAQLGDPSGAALAYARMRERAGREPSALAWLEEAAHFEQERGDLHAAQRHLASAIGIAPGDAAREARYRALGERIAVEAGVRVRFADATHAAHATHARAADDAHAMEARDEDERARAQASAEDADTRMGYELDAAPVTVAWPAMPVPAPPAVPDAAAAPAALAAPPPVGTSLEDDATCTRFTIDEPAFGGELSYGDAEAELRIESLTRTLQGDPTNDAVVDELVALLTRLGRGMDLLALLSARLEDAPPERREALLPKHREALATLEQEARAAGRDAEADLFKMARDAS